ncbi:MAG: amidohydrolase family protein [Lachnospiraceae bacterium]|nr:amidohydrolase family protein [Lachnospiraceae bacterium]
MPPVHHRHPGVIGAAAERDTVTAELICDGIHVHPSAVRMAFKLFPGRICLISDSLRCCGMPDGTYELGGQTVTLKDHIARLGDGTIAGSATHLFDCMRNAVRFGIPEEEAIRAATINPARRIGADDRIGSIEIGKAADYVVCDEGLHLKQVCISQNY